jgi:nucleotide-binding universal stress UspA family protein
VKGETVMIRIPNILVPVDFSDASKRAVNYGLSFGLGFESKLILAHIAPYDTAAYEKAKADLMKLIPADCRDRLHFEIIVKSGDVRPELLGIVEDREIDLVVMGTHGRTGIRHFMAGSVTERVVRSSRVPVLTIRHPD